MILGIDASHWQKKIDWPLLAQNGVKFAILKITQGDNLLDDRAQEHCEGAAAAGMAVGAYHYVDQDKPAAIQAAYFIERLRTLPMVQFWALDIEEQEPIGRTTNPTRLSDTARQIMLRWRTAGVPMLIYTRPYFVEYKCRPMYAWIGQYDLWAASYPFKPGSRQVTWDELKRAIPSPTALTFPASWPVRPPVWKFWQFSGGIHITPGMGSGDYNVFNGDEDALRAWLAGKPVEEQPEDEGEAGRALRVKVATRVLNVRSGPGVNYPAVDRLPQGTTVEALGVGGTDAWVKIGEGRWICVQQGGQRLAEIVG